LLQLVSGNYFSFDSKKKMSFAR